MMTKNIAIIGAGPVGLWTAIQIKLNNPDFQITMFERYETYKRNHPLKLEKSSFSGAKTTPALDKLIRAFPSHPRTTELENTFSEYADTLGIKIKKGKAKSKDDMDKSQFDLVVAADGAHSSFRQVLHEQESERTDNDELIHDETEILQYVVDFKYEVEGQAKSFSSPLQALELHAFSNHLVVESVGKEQDGKTPVSLRVFISKDEFQQLGDRATFKDPLKLTDTMPQDLKDTLNIWLMGRHIKLKENRVSGKERITKITLGTYAARQFAFTSEQKRPYVLVGDAAFGVPYFRSLNNGILSGTRLAQYIRDHFSEELTQEVSCGSGPEKGLLQYEQFMQHFSAQQARTAGFKRTGIELLNLMREFVLSPSKKMSSSGKTSFGVDSATANLIILKRNLEHVIHSQGLYASHLFGGNNGKIQACRALHKKIVELQQAENSTEETIREGLVAWCNHEDNTGYMHDLKQERSLIMRLLKALGWRHQTRTEIILDRVKAPSDPK